MKAQRISHLHRTALNRAVDLKNKYPDAIVSISENKKDGTWSLNVTTTPDTQRYGKNGLPLGMYLDSEITQAKKSKFKNAELVSEDGKRTKVNLQDLVQAGKRINESEGGTNFNEGGPVSAAQRSINNYGAVVRTWFAYRNRSTSPRSSVG